MNKYRTIDVKYYPLWRKWKAIKSKAKHFMVNLKPKVIVMPDANRSYYISNWNQK